MKLPLTYLLISLASIAFLGDAARQDIIVLIPSTSGTVSYDQSKLLIVSAAKEAVPQLLLSTQWEKQFLFDLEIEGNRESFARDFYALIPYGATIELLSYSFRYFKGFTKPESLASAYLDTLTIRGLWQKPQFAQLVKRVQLSSDISEVFVTVRGWIDSTITTPYEDPNTSDRALYKLHVRLLPGANQLYCAPNGRKEDAVLYASTLAMESKPAMERPTLFHNSTLEQSCVSCHEGLPSSFNGDSMSADCNVCHKLMSAGSLYQHAPAEMKECSSCHSWSKENHAVVVEKGVPTVCYDCHSEKQEQVESSTSMHPVAAECLTCHSTHGSDQKHIVKEDVYSLCTSCHEDQKMNHPVGRHPLRFLQLRDGSEISCISCHNPHGSPNESLLKAPGGRMGVCEQCH